MVLNPIFFAGLGTNENGFSGKTDKAVKTNYLFADLIKLNAVTSDSDTPEQLVQNINTSGNLLGNTGAVSSKGEESITLSVSDMLAQSKTVAIDETSATVPGNVANKSVLHLLSQSIDELFPTETVKISKIDTEEITQVLNAGNDVVVTDSDAVNLLVSLSEQGLLTDASGKTVVLDKAKAAEIVSGNSNITLNLVPNEELIDSVISSLKNMGCTVDNNKLKTSLSDSVISLNFEKLTKTQGDGSGLIKVSKREFAKNEEAKTEVDSSALVLGVKLDNNSKVIEAQKENAGSTSTTTQATALPLSAESLKELLLSAIAGKSEDENVEEATTDSTDKKGDKEVALANIIEVSIKSEPKIYYISPNVSLKDAASLLGMTISGDKEVAVEGAGQLVVVGTLNTEQTTTTKNEELGKKSELFNALLKTEVENSNNATATSVNSKVADSNVVAKDNNTDQKKADVIIEGKTASKTEEPKTVVETKQVVNSVSNQKIVSEQPIVANTQQTAKIAQQNETLQSETNKQAVNSVKQAEVLNQVAKGLLNLMQSSKADTTEKSTTIKFAVGDKEVKLSIKDGAKGIELNFEVPDKETENLLKEIIPQATKIVSMYASKSENKPEKALFSFTSTVEETPTLTVKGEAVKNNITKSELNGVEVKTSVANMQATKSLPKQMTDVTTKATIVKEVANSELPKVIKTNSTLSDIATFSPKVENSENTPSVKPTTTDTKALSVKFAPEISKMVKADSEQEMAPVVKTETKVAYANLTAKVKEIVANNASVNEIEIRPEGKDTYKILAKSVFGKEVETISTSSEKSVEMPVKVPDFKVYRLFNEESKDSKEVQVSAKKETTDVATTVEQNDVVQSSNEPIEYRKVKFSALSKEVVKDIEKDVKGKIVYNLDKESLGTVTLEVKEQGKVKITADNDIVKKFVQNGVEQYQEQTPIAAKKQIIVGVENNSHRDSNVQQVIAGSSNDSAKKDVKSVKAEEKDGTDVAINKESGVSAAEQQSGANSSTDYRREGKAETDFGKILHQVETKHAADTFKTALNVEVQESVKQVKYVDLVKEINKLIADKEKGNITFNLTPDNLGKLKINLNVIDNVVNAKIECENPAVKVMLENNLPNLFNSAHQNGLQFSSMQISLNMGDQQKQQKSFYSKKQGKESEAKTEKVEMDEESSKKFGYNTYEYLV